MTDNDLARHVPTRRGYSTGVVCPACSVPWPCPTAEHNGTADQPLPDQPGPSSPGLTLSPHQRGN